MEMLEQRAPGVQVLTRRRGRSGAIEHLSISFQQRRTIVVSFVSLICLLAFELLFGYSLITTQIDLLVVILLVILVLVFDVFLSTLIGWLTAEPLAILAYLRAVRREQQTNSRV